MIVDDEPFNLQSLLYILKLSIKELGHEDTIIDELTDMATNGKEAIDLAKKQALKGMSYGLVFMDCSMPVMDGFDATLHLRQLSNDNLYDQPYIAACTGHTEDEYILKAWRHKMDEVIPKPATIEVIKEILKERIKISLNPEAKAKAKN